MHTGLLGCKNISDDIIVLGATVAERDQNLFGVLTRLQQHDVRLNEEKCSFSRSEVTFYGHVFSSEGIRADPEKIEAITNMSEPENASEVRSLLGMAQYVSRYIAEYAYEYFSTHRPMEAKVDAVQLSSGVSSRKR